MSWKVRWQKRAIKDMERFGHADRERIARFFRDRVSARDDPREIGEALSGPFSDYWKYRVDAFRVIASIDDQAVTIMIVRVGNRRDIYR